MGWGCGTFCALGRLRKEMTAVNYRDIPYIEPRPGVELPAFVVSEYGDGSLLLYSHGDFDIMCVYRAVRLDDVFDASSSRVDEHPFRRDEIVVKKLLGSKTRFSGSFVEYGFVDYSFSAPGDAFYMRRIRELARKYGKDRVWDSFWELYESIPQKRDIQITKEMTEKVEKIASQYPRESDLHLILECLLCAMIAENNRLKKYGSRYDTKLGKKIKALGVFQAIYETDMSIREVVDFSDNADWRWISGECYKRGILTPDM